MTTALIIFFCVMVGGPMIGLWVLAMAGIVRLISDVWRK